MTTCRRIHAVNEMDASLIERLTDVFKQSFPQSKRLEIAGILSYTTDDSCEKFIKIDFSSEAQSDDKVIRQTADNPIPSPVDRLHSDVPTSVSINTTDKLCYRNASPPLLPPLLLQANRQPRLFTRNNVIPSAVSPLGSKLGEDCLGVARRDRRKCRRPKRQIFNLNTTYNEENEDPEFDEPFEPYCEDQSKRVKISDGNDFFVHINEHDNGNPLQTTETVDERACNRDCSDKSFSSPSTSNSSLQLLSVPLQQLSKILPQCSQEFLNIPTAIQPQATQAKLAFSTKTVGDLGEFCNLLPLNTLLGHTVVSGVDNSGLAVKVGVTATSVTQPVMLPNCEAMAQAGGNSISMSNLQNPTNSNQGVFLNPNLAAAIAAALSGTVNLSSLPNGLSTQTESCTTGAPHINAPSIALTGPSGEFLGTIPIGTTTLQHNIASNNGLSLGSNSSNSLSPLNIPVPPNTSLGVSPSIVNTINWLKNASATVDSNVQQIGASLSLPTSGIALPNGSSTPGSVTFDGQAVPRSISPKQQPVTSVSVGPTLALIGTLGLNSGISSAIYPGGGNSNSSLTINSPHGINMGGSASNSAALVAAALLRGLTNIRQPQPESEGINGDTCTINSTGSVTFITSPNNGRAGLCAVDGPPGQFNSSFAPKSITSNPASFQCIPSVGFEGSNPLMATIFNRGAGGTNSRGSIMFSYPRVTGEVNLLLASAPLSATKSSHPSSIPTSTITFQNASNVPPTEHSATALALRQPAPSQAMPKDTTPVTSTTSASSCTVSTTPSEHGSSIKVDSTSAIPRTEVNLAENNRHVSQLPDATASAIDRILQTIKGCMTTAEGRENDSRIKFHSSATKLDSIVSEPNINSSSKSGEVENMGLKSESKKVFSVKLAPVALCMGKEGTGGAECDSPQKQLDMTKTSVSSTERLPLTPLAKCTNESENLVNGVPRVYRCRYCGKSFNRKFCRERHERLHTGVKPYTCELCDEKFIRLEDKKRHVRSLQHCLAGRAAAMKVGSVTLCDINRDVSKSELVGAPPSFGHALNDAPVDCADDNFTEPDDIVGIDTSEESSNERGSECESIDAEESVTKEVEFSLEVNPLNTAHVEQQYVVPQDDTLREKEEVDEPSKHQSLSLTISIEPSSLYQSAIGESQAESSRTTAPNCPSLSGLNPALSLSSDTLCISSVVTH